MPSYTPPGNAALLLRALLVAPINPSLNKQYPPRVTAAQSFTHSPADTATPPPSAAVRCLHRPPDPPVCVPLSVSGVPRVTTASSVRRRFPANGCRPRSIGNGCVHQANRERHWRSPDAATAAHAPRRPTPLPWPWYHRLEGEG